MQRKSLVFLSTLLLVLLFNVSGGSTTEWWVGPGTSQSSSPNSPSKSSPSSSNCGTSQSQCCSSLADLLQGAKNVVQPGDIIHLLPGIYSGPLNVGLTINIPDLQILGDDASTVTIDLGGSPVFLTINVPGVVIAQVTIKGGITANANLGVINIQLTAAATVTTLLDAIKLTNVNFLDIQGTAVLCADVNVLNGVVDVKINANIFVNVVLSGCSFVNVTVDPVIQVAGRISLRLNSVSFTDCGSPDVDGAIVLATQSSAVVLVAVTIDTCQGASLLDLNTAATLTLNGVLVLKANVVSVSLLNLNLNLDINLLGVSVRLDANTAPVSCTNVKCGLVNIGCICSNCGLVNLDLGSFF